MINLYFLLILFSIFKGKILYFEKIGPEKINKKNTIRLYLGKKLAGGSDHG